MTSESEIMDKIRDMIYTDKNDSKEDQMEMFEQIADNCICEAQWIDDEIEEYNKG